MPDTGRHTSRHGGKRIESASNELMDVVSRGWGLWEISQCHERGGLTIRTMDAEPREKRQADMDRYTATEIALFPPAKPKRGGRLRPAFLDLWPGFYEDHLQADSETRLGDVDRDIRRLIDGIVNLFDHNLRRYVRVKRSLQFLAIAVLALLAAAAIAVAFTREIESGAARFAAPVAFLVLVPVLLWCYRWLNGHIYRNYYRHALQNSVHRISLAIRQRMNDIKVCETEYVASIDRTLRKGQDSAGSVQQPQSQVSGDAYLWTEMLYWLPIRVREIQLYFRSAMQESQRRHCFNDARGFAATSFIFFLFFVPAAAALAFATAAIASGMANPLAWMVAALVLGITVLATTRISWLSYYNPQWNSARDILEHDFDMEQWQTFSEFNSHKTLGTRSQHAMDSIAHLLSVLSGRHRG